MQVVEKVEHFDVLIVGAGISGVGSAYHLTRQCPGTSFVVLDAQASFGGTWITHRFPGIRSDSDLYTFGQAFKPWIDPDDFNPGYMMRSMHLLPKRGDKPEWAHTQDYWTEKDEFPAIDLDDEAFVYSPA